MLQVVVIDENNEVMWSGDLELNVPIEREDGLDEFRTQGRESLIFSARGELPAYQLMVKVEKRNFLGSVWQEEQVVDHSTRRWRFDCNKCDDHGLGRGYGSHNAVLDALTSHIFRSHLDEGVRRGTDEQV